MTYIYGGATKQGHEGLVIDIFSGSNTAGHTAEKLRRKWKSFELSREYVAASAFRFSETKEEALKNYERIIRGK